MRRLRAGDRPDVVIFLNGVNDILSAYQTGRADVHPNLRDIAGLFDNPRGYSPSLDELLRDEFETSTYTGALIERAFGSDEEAVVAEQTYASLGVSADELGAAVARRYLGTYRIIEALAAGYGFDFYVFWQPTIFLGGQVAHGG